MNALELAEYLEDYSTYERATDIEAAAMCRAAVEYMNGAGVYGRVPREALDIEEGIYREVWIAMQAASPPPPTEGPLLTDAEIEREWQFLHDEEGNPPDQHDFARAIEQAVRQNAGLK